jgi:ATP/maltotriose-dependent transcriptional regulator MalT
MSDRTNKKPVGRLTFVGRERELSQLRAMLDDAKSGVTRIAVLGGEPGIGKTRTATEFSDIAGSEGFQVRWARCYEDRGSPPLWPWIQLLQSIVDAHGLEQTKDLLGESFRYFAEKIDTLKEEAAVHQFADAASPQAKRFHFFVTYARFLDRVTRNEPVLLVIDDLHRADSSSLHLLEYLAHELDSSNLMILCAYRNIGIRKKSQLALTLGELVRNARFQHMILGPFCPDELEEFVHRTTGIALQQKTVTYLQDRTEGVPLYLREIVNEIIADTGAYRGSSSAAILTAEIPETLNLAVMQRLSTLTSHCRQSLVRAAVIGRTFSSDLLPRAPDSDMSSKTLEEAIDAGVVEEVDGEPHHYRFSHVLIKDVLLQSVSNAERAKYHEETGLLLEERYGCEAENNSEELVHHFALAQSPGTADRLARYALIAGDQALAGYSLDEAIHYFRCALTVKGDSPIDDEKAKIISGLGRALVSHSQVSEAIGYLISAFDFFDAGGNVAKAVEIVTHSLLIPHMDRRELCDLAERALRLAPDDSSLLARVLSFRAKFAYHQQILDYPAAKTDLHRALEIATRNGDQQTKMLVLFLWGSVAYMESVWSECSERIDEAMSLARVNDEPAIEAYSCFLASMVAMRTGDAETLRRRSEHALTVSERLCDRSLISKALIVRAYIYAIEGNWPLARDTSDRVLARDPGVDAHGVLGGRAILEYETGCYERGDEFLARLLLLCDDPEFPKLALYTWIPSVVGRLLLIRGSGVKGIDVARRVGRPHLRDVNNRPFFTVPICIGLGLIEATQGNSLEAEKYYRMIDAAYDGTPMAVDNQRMLGVLADHAGDFKGASHQFAKSLDLALRNENRVAAAWCRHDCANAMVRHGGTEQLGTAKTLLRDALGAADALGLVSLKEHACSLIDLIANQEQDKNHDHTVALTKRELEVLEQVALGKTNQEISRDLLISENTVSNHIKRIYSKIGVTNRVDAATYAIREGIVTI